MQGADVHTEGGAGTIVGREAELGEAGAAIADALAGEVAMCLFVGSAGAGKTTLWRAAIDLAQAAGFAVLSCAPAAQEAQLGYASLADLLGGIDRAHFDRLPGPQRHAILAALQEEASGPVPDHAAAAGLRSVLIELAGEGPVCIAIDDLQWMDRSSQRAFGFALRRIEGLPLLVLGTRRQNVTSGRLEREAPIGARVRVVHPGPLRVAAIHHVLLAALGSTFPRPTLVRITTLANGNPLLAIELARSVLAKGGVLQAGDRAALAGPNVRRLLGRRLADLDDDREAHPPDRRARRGRARWRRHERCMRRSTGRSGRRGPETGLIVIDGDRIEFGHPLYIEAVLAAATPDRRIGHPSGNRLAHDARRYPCAAPRRGITSC